MVRSPRETLSDRYNDLSNRLVSSVDPSKIGTSSRNILKWNCIKCGKQFDRRVSDYTRSLGLCNNCTRLHRKQVTTVRSESVLQWFTRHRGYIPETVDGSDLSKISRGSTSRKIEFVCKLGHKFKLTPYQVTQGQWCPFCKRSKRISRPVLALYMYYYNNANMELEYSVPNASRLSIDLYFPNYKLGIEYDGQRYHNNLQRDIDKDKLCNQFGIKILRLREPLCPRPEIVPNTWCVLNNPVDEAKDLYDAVQFIYRHSTLPLILPDITLHKAWDDMYKYIYNGIIPNNLYEYEIRNPSKDYVILESNSVLMSMSYNESRRKITIKCNKCGYEFSVTPYNYICNKSGCPACAGKIVSSQNNLSNYGFSKYFSALNMIDKTEVYYKSDTKWIWQCEHGHYYVAEAWRLAAGQRCPTCSNNEIHTGFNDLETWFPKLAEYFVDRELPSKVAKNAQVECDLYCKECGTYFMCKPVNLHKRRHICPNWRNHTKNE